MSAQKPIPLTGHSADGSSLDAWQYTDHLWDVRPACTYCGVKIKEGKGTLDHVVPTSQGGQSTTANVVLCCVFCNQSKRDRTLEKWIEDLLDVLDARRKSNRGL